MFLVCLRILFEILLCTRSWLSILSYSTKLKKTADQKVNTNTHAHTHSHARQLFTFDFSTFVLYQHDIGEHSKYGWNQNILFWDFLNCSHSFSLSLPLSLSLTHSESLSNSFPSHLSLSQALTYKNGFRICYSQCRTALSPMSKPPWMTPLKINFWHSFKLSWLILILCLNFSTSL